MNAYLVIEELEREIKVRQRCYPRWIDQHKLDPVTADRRLLIMVAIRERLANETT